MYLYALMKVNKYIYIYAQNIHVGIQDSVLPILVSDMLLCSHYIPLLSQRFFHEPAWASEHLWNRLKHVMPGGSSYLGSWFPVQLKGD